jgi:hypothetical protein
VEKTIKEWLEDLPEPYRSEALANFDDYVEIYPTKLREKELSTKHAIINAFNWEGSTEGGEYWRKVYARY